MNTLLKYVFSYLTVGLILTIPLSKAGHAQQCNAQGCSSALEFNYHFDGYAPPLNNSKATLLIRLVDKRIRFIATSPMGDTDTQTIPASKFNCFKGGVTTGCDSQDITRIVFESNTGQGLIRGDVLVSPYLRAVVDVMKDNQRLRFLLHCCGSIPLISSGLATTKEMTAAAPPQTTNKPIELMSGSPLTKYEGTKYKDKVFRRGQDKATIQVAKKALNGGNLTIKIFKVAKDGREKLVQELKQFNEQNGVLTTSWMPPADSPIGIYRISGISSKLTVDVANCFFYVIFNTPAGLKKEEQAAYLYDDGNINNRDAESIHYNLYKWKGKLKQRPPVKPEGFWWQEQKYLLKPFSEKIFGLAIEAANDQLDETTVATGLMNAVSRQIEYYKHENGTNNVSAMFKPINIPQFKAAYDDPTKETQTIKGMCLDYANSLTAFARTLGMPSRVATGLWNQGFMYHEWSEIFLSTKASDKWLAFDAMDDVPWDSSRDNDPDYPAEHAQKDKNEPPMDGGGPFSRKVYRLGGQVVFDVAVGNANWKVETIAENDKSKIEVAGSWVKRKVIPGQADDALLEKCEQHHYNDETCPATPQNLIAVPNSVLTPLTTSSSYLAINLNKDIYRVGEQIAATVTIMNPDGTPINGTFTYRVLTYTKGDDGRNAFNIPGGIFGTRLFEASENVNLLPGESVSHRFSFILPALQASPKANFYAEAEFNGSVEDYLALDFNGIPGFDLNVTMPSTMEPLEPIPVQASITNQSAYPIFNINAELDFPDYYELNPGSVSGIPRLNPGETKPLSFVIQPRELNLIYSLPFDLTVQSDNAGNLRQSLETAILTPPTLSIPNASFQKPESGVLPVNFQIANLGKVDASDVTIKLILPGDLPTGSVIPQDSQFAIPTLKAGESVELSTNVTISINKDVHIQISAVDSFGNTGTGLLSIISP